MSDKKISILITLLLFDIALTIRSNMINYNSAVLAAENKIGLLSCYSSSLNFLSVIFLVGALIFGIFHIREIGKEKYEKIILLALFVIFSISALILWSFCDLNF